MKLPIPGLQLDFTLEKPAIVMIWMNGLAYPNSGFDTETGVYLMFGTMSKSPEPMQRWIKYGLTLVISVLNP